MVRRDGCPCGGADGERAEEGSEAEEPMRSRQEESRGQAEESLSAEQTEAEHEVRDRGQVSSPGGTEESRSGTGRVGTGRSDRRGTLENNVVELKDRADGE